MLVLGINAHHADAAAALFQDGQLVAAVEEERLNRIKHYAGFPALAIQEVLRIAGVEFSDIDEIGLARDSRANLRKRVAWALRNLRGISRVARKRLKERAGLVGIEEQICEACGQPRAALKAKVRRVEHHLAHAASSFLVSPFERAAILTVDGFGDFASALTAVGEGSRIRPLGRVTWPHSLGILYTMVSQFIGFDRYGDEGKVMGLAPYGERTFTDFFDRLLRPAADGYELDLRYFNHHTEGVETGNDENGGPRFDPLYTEAMIERFGPPRVPGEAITDRDRNLAAGLQQRLEDVLVDLACRLHERTGLFDLCLAGGVALNGVANGVILERTPFKRIFIQPAAGDDGTALGACAWLAAAAGESRFEMKHAAWGSSFSQAQIDRAIEDAGGEYLVEHLEEADLLQRTAAEIAEGRVVGWFQGAMEWGPRALGNRSIVAHPGHPRMKEILNARVKQREEFRPFAPSILEERLSDYYQADHPSPFMLMVYRSRESRRRELCAVDHIDHTGRVHTVSCQQNPLFYGLLQAFERRTGTPVLLNTSFNENEPIVCTPGEALECFSRTRMDAVVLGSALCRRRETAGAGKPASAAAATGADGEA